MKKASIIERTQAIFGVTKSELIFVFLAVVGLLIGFVIRQIEPPETKKMNNEAIAEQIFRTYDSLAEVNKTSYIGTDIRNSPNEELAKADTVVEQETGFPTYKQKELPKGRINLNTASKVELMKIPWVGDKTAIKIIEYRDKHPFRRIEDIKNITGIGAKKFEKMKDFIKV